MILQGEIWCYSLLGVKQLNEMLIVNWHMIAQQIHDFVLLPTL